MKAGYLLENMVVDHALELASVEEMVLQHKQRHHIENNFCVTLLRNKYTAQKKQYKSTRH